MQGFYIFTQNNSFYYYGAEKTDVAFNNSYISVKFNSNSSFEQKRNIVSRYSDLNEFTIINKEITKDLYVLSTTTSLTNERIEILLSQLENEPLVNFAGRALSKNGSVFLYTDEINFKLKSNYLLSTISNILVNSNCSKIQSYPFDDNIKTALLNKLGNLTTIQTANLLFETGYFEFVEPNFIFLTSIASIDPFFSQQWALKNTGQSGGTVGSDMKIEQAWQITEGRSDVKIAVIDNGVDLTHPDLAQNLLQGFNGFDLSNNGSYSDPSTETHGTAVSGIIGAVKDNNLGISGVAPKCKILPIKAIIGIGTSDITTANACAAAIDWAWQNGADVISNSWTIGVGQSVIDNAILNAVTNGRGGLGCVLLFSTGNQSLPNIGYPSSNPNVLSVGSTNDMDTKSSFSNYGSFIDLTAPGEEIYTLDLQGANGKNSTDFVSDFSGTSASCPFAAGVAALVLSVNRCLNYTQVKQVMELSCDKVSGECYNGNNSNPNGSWNKFLGHGRVNAYNAVRFAFDETMQSFNNQQGIDQGETISGYTQIILTQPIPGVAAGTYIVKPHLVTANFIYTSDNSSVINVSTNGLSLATQNDGCSFAYLSNLTSTGFTANTYVYEAFDVLSNSIGWIPNPPNSTFFNANVFDVYSNDLYLQNQNISTNEIFVAINKIEAGENVHPTHPIGNYNILSGSNTNLKAVNKIRLANGFKAEYGSNFKAEISPLFTCTQYPNGRMSNPIVKEIEILTLEDNSLSNKISSDFNTLSKLDVYPNPFNSEAIINYSLTKDDVINLKIYDQYGQLVNEVKSNLSQKAGSYSLRISDLSLTSGIYYLRLTTSENEISKKIVKLN